MKRVDNKGLSTIIATLIIILLVFVAVTILWFSIRNLISGGTGQIDLSAKCIDTSVKPMKVNNTNGSIYQVTVLRESGDDEIGGIKLIFTNEDSDANFIQDVSGNIGILEVKTVNVTVTGVSNPNKVEAVVYFLDNKGNDQYCQSGESFSF